jgi:hypothetical protein
LILLAHAGRAAIGWCRTFTDIIMRVISLGKRLLLCLAFPVVAIAQAAPRSDTTRVDIVGKWAFSVQSDVGSGTPTVTFATQKGDSITGRYSSQALGEHDFVGTYKGGKIAFGFTAEAGGQSFSMAFAGAVDDKDSMSGAIDFAGMATGTFSGKRIKP